MKSKLNKRKVCYEKWVKTDEIKLEKHIKNFPSNSRQHISFTIINLLENDDVNNIEKCLDAIKKQSYKNFKVINTFLSSPNAKVIKFLTRYCAKDSRFENKFEVYCENLGIINSTENWIKYQSINEIFHKHCLLILANEIGNNSDAKFIYYDSDFVDLRGKRSSPNFKADWNQDLLYNQNYIEQTSIYRSDTLIKAGNLRTGYYEKSQFDLNLRITAILKRNEIVHLSKILGHKLFEETVNFNQQKKIISDFLSKDYFATTVGIDNERNVLKLNWPLGDSPLISLIMPTYNGYEITKQAIESIIDNTIYSNYEILLVDNNSDCPKALKYFEEINKHKKVNLLKYPYPFNYSAINNFAVKHAQGKIVGLINNDIEVINAEWLTEMVSNAIRKDIGCVGAKLYYPDNTIQHGGVIVGLWGVAGHSHKFFPRTSKGYQGRLNLVQNYTAVTAACLLVKKSIYEEVNGLNDKNLTVAFNDVDFCLKVAKAGYRNLWTPYAELYHHESISRGFDTTPEKKARSDREIEYMHNTWGTCNYKDPAYNPNLTLKHENFSLKVDSYGY